MGAGHVEDEFFYLRPELSKELRLKDSAPDLRVGFRRGC